MAGPVTIRTLDPPLHEFLPVEESAQRQLAADMGVSYETVKAKVESFHEFNPMIGFRGCRLGIVYPEITRMQTQAIFEAAAKRDRSRTESSAGGYDSPGWKTSRNWKIRPASFGKWPGR